MPPCVTHPAQSKHFLQSWSCCSVLLLLYLLDTRYAEQAGVVCRFAHLFNRAKGSHFFINRSGRIFYHMLGLSEEFLLTSDEGMILEGIDNILVQCVEFGQLVCSIHNCDVQTLTPSA